jgi:nitrogen fixation/metabolism regulation signal transduction histidine kinase
MAEAATAPAPAAGGRHQRRMRNYLLDRHFQLKYTGYLVGIAVVLSVSLGIALWLSGRKVIDQSQATVTQGEQVVDVGRKVVEESRKVSAVVQMNIVKDPVYADSPELLSVFKEDAAAQDERLKKQQDQLETQAAQLKTQAADLQKQQRNMFGALVLLLSLLVVGIGFAGIVVTHRVAGPIFKMKKQLKDVAEGHLTIPGRLRKGDELVDFFDAFIHMVQSLRARQENEIALLDKSIAKLKGKADDSDMEGLLAVRAEMQSALESTAAK